jgi:murein DD-endopeptidase MepM/ murein hydrolase activator NlpD
LKSLKKLLFLIIVIGLLAATFTYFRDTAAPLVQLTPTQGPISASMPLSLKLTDEGSGLKSLRVEAVQGNNRQLLLTQDFPPQTPEFRLELTLGDKKLQDGPLTIEVTSGDRAIYHLGQGNHSQVQFEFTYDSRAPVISILSRAHNFRHGGAGLVRYQLNEEVEQSGVEVGDHFFPGFRQPDGDFVALVAWPWDMLEKDFIPRVKARDLAGNERQAGIYYHSIARKFRQRTINLSDSFLQQKAPEFEPLAPGLSDPLAIFLKINSEVRAQNRQKMKDLARQTAATPLWKGEFSRQPGASTLAIFADDRDYLYQGKVVDHATHLGYDLASVARAEVPAANNGVVIFADYLGIYGQCIVIDHGLGLQTLYAHLSQIDVAPGDQVNKNQIIGRTGASGMAGGDHLHFGVFVGGLAVQPLEWWDASWLQNNIDSKLQ